MFHTVVYTFTKAKRETFWGSIFGDNDNANFQPRRGKSNRLGKWERFGALNQAQQSPIYNSQRNTMNQDRGFKQNFRSRGKI